MEPPAFVRLAAHPLRWRLLTSLAAGDHRVRELTDLVGEPQNLVSYHLRLLREEGLVASRRSDFDGRDSYYHLDLDRCSSALASVGAALHPALRPSPSTTFAPRHVLFTCTGNSARSPVAEALLRHHTRGQVSVTSAGSHPKPHINPHAVLALRSGYGIDIAAHPRSLDEVAGHRFDHVISLCDRVREVLPAFPGSVRTHWSLAEPDTYPVFQRITAEIDTRVRHLLPSLQEVPA
ncbi:ArsR family transcriptional regulator [Lentzea tibetensis]|uniref:ArsR family transcriptional regulator n=1 Tax=Lentzea tibetensis TaxID=2591470 RepID=A0A563EME4_9PSEU|nr:ArsR family transcriptional regulator [Lentzea tibetensis]TWP48329.1 ArsR family transcriptional regulator [Lentzea tibetensis]